MAEGERHGSLATDCIAEAGREIRQLRKLLFLSLVVNVALSGAIIVAIVLRAKMAMALMGLLPVPIHGKGGKDD